MALSNQKGVLYVVATPIGHLQDITLRAIETLKAVDCIAAEDTRHSQRLLQHYGISAPIRSLHEHNESSQSAELISMLEAGQSIALISDAGTPLISDPGFQLVEMARDAEIPVSPIPGPSAVIAALSSAGLPTSHFSFVGFLPRTGSARQAVFQSHDAKMGTLIFYESCHRIEACLDDLCSVYGETHVVAMAREMTKAHETIVRDALGSLRQRVQSDPNMRKGEFVVLVSAPGESDVSEQIEQQLDDMLGALLSECSLKTSVALAVKLTGLPKKKVYARALDMKQP